MSYAREDAPLQPIRRAAARLGVPLAWLRREAEAGRIPAVRAGRQWHIPMERAREALIRRAEGEAAGADSEAGPEGGEGVRHG